MTGTGLEVAFAQTHSLGTAEIFEAFLLALVLGVVVALIYRISVPGRVLSPAMQSSLVVLAMVGSMVMMVIGNNIARAFSLVGALAIIRFRTRLRSPWDITFVFLALAVGIACGVFAFRVAVVGTFMVGLTVLLLFVLPLSGIRGEVHNLRCDVAAYEATEGSMAEVMERFLARRWLVEARSLQFGETFSYRYRVVLRDRTQLEAMLRALSEVEGIERVILETGENGSAEA